ncbi:Retrovirus-related Pol polyprotein from transposon TNT 1-94 [Senna tora]|uniref:Retrovirus-related Pol polyprotein from transposon TNT 1-94 n=1 Tax=Senna tora TaxID=362788 RepID=A0A834VYK2_9FABA|nr:Retrovirus-related Pol polyprotein from transposon TNT 1-94 [Senna tora]
MTKICSYGSVMAALLGHGLETFIEGKRKIPDRFKSAKDREAGKVLDCIHSYQVMDRVIQIFGINTRARAHQFRTELRNTKKGEKTMADNILKMKSILDSLAAIGSEISEHDLIQCILEGLPGEYESFVTSFYLKSEPVSIWALEASLIAQEVRVEKSLKAITTTQASANVAATDSKDKSNSNAKSGGQNQLNNRPFFNNNNNRGRGRSGFNFGRGRAEEDLHRVSIVTISNPLDLIIISSLDKDLQGICLPCLQLQICSVIQLSFLTLEQRIMPLLNMDSKEILLRGSIRPDGLYVFNDFQLQHRPVSLQASLSQTPMVSYSVSNLNDSTQSSVSSSYSIWHARYTWIYPLKNKSQALQTFIDFKYMVELQVGLPIKFIQSDWGGEFRSFTSFLKTHGIIHRVSCPYAHQQNGSVERKHRHITELGLAMLAYTSLPLSFWEDAFASAAYLINRLPSKSSSGQSPFSTLFHQVPDYHFLRVFGCAYYPLLRPFNKHKLEYRTQRCTFIGYSLSHKGYKCLAPCGRVYISRDVKFDESFFPYKHFSSSSFVKVHSPLSSATPPILSTLSNVQPTGPVTESIANDTLIPITDVAPNNDTIVASGSGASSSSNSAGQNDVQSSVQQNQSIAVSTLVPAHQAFTHPMITRAKAGIFKPKVLLAYTLPKSVKAALDDDDWSLAMQQNMMPC